MSTLLEKSRTQDAPLPSGKDKVVGIVVSEWNSPITESLLKGAIDTLIAAGVKENDIIPQLSFLNNFFDESKLSYSFSLPLKQKDNQIFQVVFSYRP